MLVNGANPLRLLDELRDLGDAEVTPGIEAIPPLEALDPLACLTSWRVRLATRAPRAPSRTSSCSSPTTWSSPIEEPTRAREKPPEQAPAPDAVADAGGARRAAKESATIRVQADGSTR